MIFNKELHANKPQIKVNSRALCSIGGSVDVRHHLQHYLLQCPITIYLHLLKTLAAFFIPLLHSINFNQNPKHYSLEDKKWCKKLGKSSSSSKCRSSYSVIFGEKHRKQVSEFLVSV